METIDGEEDVETVGNRERMGWGCREEERGEVARAVAFSVVFWKRRKMSLSLLVNQDDPPHAHQEDKGDVARVAELSLVSLLCIPFVSIEGIEGV